MTEIVTRPIEGLAQLYKKIDTLIDNAKCLKNYISVPDIDFETLVDKSTPLNFRGYFEKFSNRERQIICMNAHGCSTKYICEALCISPATFKTYLSQIYQKIFFVCNDRNDNFSKRTRLALYYLQAIGKLDGDWHIE